MDAVKKPGLLSVVFYALAMNLAIRWLANGAAIGPRSLPIWVAAAILFLAPLIFATLDLSGRYPGEGAIYAWTRETQGPFAGFMCGWLYWASNLPYFAGLLIFIVNLAASIIGGIEGGAAIGAWLKEPFGTFCLSLVLLAVIAWLHGKGLGAGKWIPIAGAAATLTIYIFLVAAGFFFGAHNGSATDFAHADYGLPASADGAILWSTMIFAYGGAEGVALLRNEIKGGIRTLTRGLIMVAILLAVAFAAGTAAMLMIIPQDLASRLGGLPEALQTAAGKLGFSTFGPWLLALLALSQTGGLSSWFGAAARLPFAAGLDDALPKSLGQTDPKTGAPVVAIWAQAFLVVVILALSQAGTTVSHAYDFIVSMGVLSYTAPYVYMFVAYWKSQKTPNPLPLWGGQALGRIMAAVGFVVVWSAILCSLAPIADPKDKVAAYMTTISPLLGYWWPTVALLFAATIMVGTGAVIYLLGKARREMKEEA